MLRLLLRRRQLYQSGENPSPMRMYWRVTKENGATLLRDHKIAFVATRSIFNMGVYLGWIQFVIHNEIGLESTLGAVSPDKFATFRASLAGGVDFLGITWHEREAFIIGSLLLVQQLTTVPRTIVHVALMSKLAGAVNNANYLRWGAFQLYMAVNIIFGKWLFGYCMRNNRNFRLYWFASNIQAGEFTHFKVSPFIICVFF